MNANATNDANEMKSKRRDRRRRTTRRAMTRGLTQSATAEQGARAAVRECANARGVVDADDCARALGTTATAARRAFDATRATSERASDDLDDDAERRSARGATDRETCEARRLMLYLAAACYATARGGGATALRDEARRCADEDASEGNEWVGREVSARSSPSRSPSKRAMLRRANGAGSPARGDRRVVDDEDREDAAFGSFVLLNWDAFADACRSDRGEGEGERGSATTLTREEVACLDYVFETRDENGERSSLADCAMASGEDAIESAHLREWVARNMSADATSMASASAMASGSAVAAVAEMAANVSESDVARPGSKTTVTVDGAYKTTVVRRQGCDVTRTASGNAAGCRTSPRDLATFGSPRYVSGGTPCAKITDCADSIIYLLEPYHYVSIVGCVDCVIVVGAVARSLRVEGCERVTLMCAAKRVTVRSCFDCNFHLGVLTQPLFVGDNRKCVLAPYNTFYEHLGEHLIEARLRPEACTAWDRPVVLGVDVTIQDGSSSPSAPDVVRISSGITLMPPDAFTLFIVPFREYVADVVADAPPTPSSVAATTQANPFDVPANYVTALESKMQLICDVRARVRDSSLPETKRGELQAAIQSHFKAWLQQSGKSREIFDLSAIEREEMRAAGGEMRAAGATAATA